MTNAPSTDHSIRTRIGSAKLLTAENGGVPASEDDRRKMALFDNSVAIITSGSRWDTRVRSAIESARRAEKITGEIEYIEADVATIMAIYRDFGKIGKAAEKTSHDIERQHQIAMLIKNAASQGASDIHLLMNRDFMEIRTRINGRMVDTSTMNLEEGKALVRATFAVASDTGNTSSDTSFQQGALTVQSGVLPPKVNLMRLQYSPTSEGRGTLVMRLIYVTKSGETEIDSLGYADQHIYDIHTMRQRTNGLYIIAGKTSSGKSTTLQRVLNKMYIDKKREITMFSIEEPVELDLPGATQVAAKKSPDGTDGFLEAMKAALRSDPDVIVLGETRSEELASLAIKAVMSGHAMWSTIHAGSALGILDRLTDLGVESWKLQDPTVVRGLIYQRLIGVMCPNCKITIKQAMAQGSVEVDLGTRLCALLEQDEEDLYARGPGCDKCLGGFVGRTVVAETIQTDPRILELFRNGQRAEMREYWLLEEEKGGMGGNPVLHHALVKVGAGVCDIGNVEEGVDLLSVYEKQFGYLKERLINDVATYRKKAS
jgi:type II secretory ATPase GspE/PulE/Tfp pilus assembly ATPase PilB-like protein